MTFDEKIERVLFQRSFTWAGYSKPDLRIAKFKEELAAQGLQIVEDWELISDKHKDGKYWLLTNKKAEESMTAYWLDEWEWQGWDFQMYGPPTHAIPMMELED